MERAELVRNKDLVSYRSLDPPPPPPCEPGVLPAPSACPGVEPSAPPMELLDVGPSTGGSGAGAEGFPTPSLPKPAAYQAEESTLHLSEDEARDALVQFAASRCCYSTAPARHLVVQGLAALNTYRYQLQTFTESRSTLPASRPYQGEFVDSWEMGVPPAPWDIAVDPPPPFADCEVHLPVPHTSEVKGCPNCSATGRAPCRRCSGSGKRTCMFCGGCGWSLAQDGLQQSCAHCQGSGRTRCTACLGEGREPCVRCATKGLLLYYLELTVTWKNNVTEYIAEKEQSLPLCRLREVTGQQLCSQEHQRCQVSDLSLPQPLERGAESCLALHQMQLSEETCILRQKQSVELIPITRVDYDWRGKLHSFYVYGNEKQVYAKDYPGKCCCALL